MSEPVETPAAPVVADDSDIPQPAVDTSPVSQAEDHAPDQQQQQQQQQQQHQPATPVTPDPVPASATEGGREVSNETLYVGGLHKSVTEDMLADLFQINGPVASIRILNDKNKPGFNYAFLKFETPAAADASLHAMNGKIINNFEININWAFQNTSNTNPNEETFNVFVGDLSPDIDDETLFSSFKKFPSVKKAHVMWDMQTSRSRGYGFVVFGSHQDAELALQTMNGEQLNGRAIRCNWASHKQSANQNQPNNFRNNGHRQNNTNRFRQFGNNHHHHAANSLPGQPNFMPHHLQQNQMGMSSFAPPTPDAYVQGGQQGQPNPVGNQVQQHAGVANMNGNGPSANGNNNNVNPPNNNNSNGNLPVMSAQSYDIILRQTPSWQTTVYLGNISHYTQQNDLIPLLQNFGFIVDFKFHPEKGCAFVKYDSHEGAALAIVQLAGLQVNGRPLKCGWGKDRPQMGNQYQNYARGVPPPPPMYGQGR